MRSQLIDMKKVPCSSPSCKGRRVHYESPDVPRGVQEFWVPLTHAGPWYCSVECMCYGKIEGERTVEVSETPPGAGPEALTSSQGEEGPGEIPKRLEEMGCEL